MPPSLPVTFVASASGSWRIERVDRVLGEGLAMAERLMVFEGREALASHEGQWVLRGVTSNTRYANRSEVDELTVKQAGLRRPEANRAALIPIRKSDVWWDLAQDERRGLFEEQSHHIRIGMDYLPAVARRLHHSRELGQDFDFLTWFEYPSDQSEAFEEMVRRLRTTPEWRYVDREVDVRLSRA